MGKGTKLRPLREDEVTFEIEPMFEHEPIEGNAMASGDEAVDKEAEDWIRDQLDSDNVWAWCTVEVRAIWTAPNGAYWGSAVLGCCSYRSREDFMKSGYYTDMKKEALDDLNTHLEAVVESGQRVLDTFGVENSNLLSTEDGYAVARLLNYSWRPVSFTYESLTDDERQIVSKEAFYRILAWVRRTSEH